MWVERGRAREQWLAEWKNIGEIGNNSKGWLDELEWLAGTADLGAALGLREGDAT